MDLLEHQGKRLFVAAGLPVLPARVARTAEIAQDAVADIGLPVVVKAQVRTGGRGKAGGIRVCVSRSEVAAAAAEILDMTIRGERVEAVLVEKAVDVARELYLAVLSSRSQRGPLLVFSTEGGVDIEEASRLDPAGFVSTPIDPLLGVCDYQVRDVAAVLGSCLVDADDLSAKQAVGRAVHAIWRAYRDNDATLAEINPLVLTSAGELVCLDSKVTIDDSALQRHPELEGDALPEADEREAKARRAGLAFVSLDGDIGVLGNGAGLVMSTIDQIGAAGGKAADFCDLGGGAGADAVAAALEVILSSPRVTALLISIFGGITRCDEVARGLVHVFAHARVGVPVVVRLDGNAAAEGRAVLARARLGGVTVADSAGEAVRLAVAAAAEPPLRAEIATSGEG